MKKNKKTVYLCSRYRASTSRQFNNQLQITKDSSREVVLAGHDVITPHLYYPTFLDDNNEAERIIGMSSAISLLDKCDILLIIAEEEHCISEGMRAEIDAAQRKNITIIEVQDIKMIENALLLNEVVDL